MGQNIRSDGLLGQSALYREATMEVRAKKGTKMGRHKCKWPQNFLEPNFLDGVLWGAQMIGAIRAQVDRTTSNRYVGWQATRALGLRLIIAMPIAVSGNNTATDEIANAVLYALQCNATIGVIDSVSLQTVEKGNDDLLRIWGTYRQKLGVSMFYVRPTELAGGVFQGTYDLKTRRLLELGFKISFRKGHVDQNCLK